ncbi:MAG TPA: 2Fe-2S iron-sulfur cluster-binding protein [Acidimicrobiia bacterium]|nr:2Fe-2S iron-sulfur cluster-binding protein [Acidimicrobiia bacterium]
MDPGLVSLSIDGEEVSVPAGSTILDACRSIGNDQPTMCWAPTLTPVNVCRVCVVEVEGSRTLVPSCSRRVEEGMVVDTDSERVRHSRKVVFELLASSVDLSLVDESIEAWMEEYECEPERFGPPAPPTDDRDRRHAGHHRPSTGETAETVHQSVKVDNPLYVRDYSKCILCYKCVQACGPEAQNTFAISVAGRGFDARISTEFDTPLPESACVYCGNCIAVCPTEALMFRSEYELRQAGMWEPERQEVTRTICSYCGVGCNLDLHVQDDRIVKVTSPDDHSVTRGNLCIKGRFGYDYVQARDRSAFTPIDEVLERGRDTV